MHQITVYQNQAAQRAALLAGLPAGSKLTLEVPPEQLPRLLALPWTRIEADGSATCEVRDQSSAPIPDAAAALAWAEAVVARQAAAREAAARQQQEHEARGRAAAERWAALPLEWRVAEGQVARCRPHGSDSDYSGPLGTSGIVVADLADLRRYVPDALAEAEAEAARQRAAADAARRAAREAQVATMRAWAEAHGSERARLLIEEQHSAWLPVAEDEYLTAAAPPGWRGGCRDPRSHAFSEKARTKPTVADIQALRLARRWIAEHSAQWPDGTYSAPRLAWIVEYYRPAEDEAVEVDDDGDAVAAQYAAIVLDLTTPTGRTRTIIGPVDQIRDLMTTADKHTV